MTATIISNVAPFGAMTNQTIADLFDLDLKMRRLQAAAASAASGFGGTAGTEYEVGTNFGVSPGDTPGTKGADYAYAIANLTGQWATFWAAALGSIQALDNGVS